MINIEENKDITQYTTFGIPVKTRFFAEYSSEKELLAITRTQEFINNRVLHIGGGSNLLFIDNFDGLVLHSNIQGIKEYRKDEDNIFVIAGAGVKWTDLVDWCIDRNYAGLENLVLIPGEVGASAVQNIGAYGVEAGDYIHRVECFDMLTRKTVVFSKEECRFGYRDSMFKHEGKGRYIVLRVAYKLSCNCKDVSLTYGPLQSFRDKLGHEPSLREIADEIIRIRNSKLPDPEILGSAGSFFKNPIVTNSYYKAFKQDYPDMPGYMLHDGSVKLSAAWLIDQCGLKGKSIGGAKVYEKQPLVIVNENGATGDDVRNLADYISLQVRSKFYVSLKPEVNYIESRIKVTVLGSGTSKGVPEVGCKCRVCTSTDSRDKRLRASVLVETNGMRILIDPSPDFRQQALNNNIVDIDAVLITHTHYDHVGGIDDLRPFCGYENMPVYLQQNVNDDLHRRLDYCFREVHYPGVPRFETIVIDKEEFLINGLKVIPIEVMHGKLSIRGYRIGDFAYITDAKTISEDEIEKLKGVDTLILNGLRDKDHFAHLTISEALDIIKTIKPRKAFLTHLNHEAGLHEELCQRLPANVQPAYDGLIITID